jgi:hypothetical protein
MMPMQPGQAAPSRLIRHGLRAPAIDAQPLIYWPFVLAAASVALVLVVGLTAAMAWVKGRSAAQPAHPLVAQAEEVANPDADLGPQPTAASNAAAVAASAAQTAAGAPAAEPAPSALRLGASPGATVGKARTPPAPREDKVADPLLPLPEDSLKAERGGETYGTQIDFVSSPAKASRQAIQEHKLVFVLHVSGNFEDAKFT